MPKLEIETKTGRYLDDAAAIKRSTVDVPDTGEVCQTPVGEISVTVLNRNAIGGVRQVRVQGEAMKGGISKGVGRRKDSRVIDLGPWYSHLTAGAQSLSKRTTVRIIYAK